jgi:glycerate dehydrogenase
MRKTRAKLLVAQSFLPREDFGPLKRHGEVYWLEDLDEKEQDRVLPSIDCIYSHGWPKSLDASKLSKMGRLRFFQAGNAGVNGMRFDLLPKSIVLCSNAGAYSDEVAEFAIGLMLAAAKSIVKFDLELRRGTYADGSQSRRQLDELGSKVSFMNGKTLGIIGYGGIGRSTARLARPFGMKVLAFGRHEIRDRGVTPLRGKNGLKGLLRESDVVVLALPLTKATRGFIGREELAAMKADAILVNVARGEVVQEQAVYDWLVKNPKFVYATDVWWPKEGGPESFSPNLPFLELDNFIGTPHASGPSALHTGSVAKGSIENLMRYFRGQSLKNVVDRSEYS